MYNAHSVSLLIAHTCKGARIYCTLQFSINPFFFSFTIENCQKDWPSVSSAAPLSKREREDGGGRGGVEGAWRGEAELWSVL